MALSSSILAWAYARAGYIYFGISSKSILFYSTYFVLGVAFLAFCILFIGRLAFGKSAFTKESKSSSGGGGIWIFVALCQWFAAVDLAFKHWHVVTEDHTYGFITFMAAGFTAVVGVLVVGLLDVLIIVIAGITGYCLGIICRIVWVPTCWLWHKFETYVDEKVPFVSNANGAPWHMPPYPHSRSRKHMTQE